MRSFCEGELMVEGRHQFHTTAGVPQTFEKLGLEAKEQAIQSVARSDESAAAGLREVRKYAQPAAEVLTAFGALTATQGQTESLGKAARAGAAVQKLIDAPEDIPVRLNMKEQWLLKRNHRQIEDMLLVRGGIKEKGGIRIYKKPPFPPQCSPPEEPFLRCDTAPGNCQANEQGPQKHAPGPEPRAGP